MSVQKEGYLSPEVAPWMARHRDENPEWFELTERLNRVAQAMMLGTAVPTTDNQALTIMLLFARALSSFQGAAILVERGMTVEARTLARSTLESAFYLGAVANDAAFVDELISADTAHKKKVANWLTSSGAAVSELTPEQTAHLTDYLDKLKSSNAVTASIKMQQAAQKAGMGDLYEVSYRELSNSAAHPSLASLRAHVEESPDGKMGGLRAGPDGKGIRDAIMHMTTALFAAISPTMEKFPHEELNAEIMACWELHKKLIDGTPKIVAPQAGK